MKRLHQVAIASVSLILVGSLAACSSTEAPPPTTAPVERADLSVGMSSTGSLAALAEQNLGFAKGGKLTSVQVKVGDQVQAGDTLATVDSAPAKHALDAQRAQLRAAEAQLDRLDDSPAVSDAKRAKSQAENILDAVRRQVAAQDAADGVAIANAQRQLTADQQAAAGAQATMNSACAGLVTPSCTSAQAAYSAAQQKVVSSQSALVSAQQRRTVDQASGRVSIETAQQSVVTAKNSVDITKSDRPHTIDQQKALVDAAKAAVRQAERDLADTTLRAPADGTVTALNGAVGEYIAPSTGTSALAPGTDASIPGSSGSTSGGTASSTGAAAGPPRPAGTQFLVLSNIDQYQVVATFNESDAATINTDQEVQVSFDALPDLTLPGKVLSIAPNGTAIAGVVSYYVTVSLDGEDERLKGGLTANVDIITSEQRDVLTVPTSAVRRVKGRSVVTVVEGGQSRTVPFEPGVVGIERTEVLSGLREGQLVALPVKRQGGGQS